MSNVWRQPVKARPTAFQIQDAPSPSACNWAIAGRPRPRNRAHHDRRNRFAAVMSNSIVHHIPEPRSALAEAVRVAKPGGLLFFRDLLRPPDEATLSRLVETYAGGECDHARQMFADSLHAALTLDEIRDLVAGLGFDPATAQTTSDRHWTWSATK